MPVCVEGIGVRHRTLAIFFLTISIIYQLNFAKCRHLDFYLFKQSNGWSLSIFIEPRAYLLQLFQSSMTRLIREEIYALTVHTQ